MSKIVDRRDQKGSNKNADRKKFLDRNKQAIKEAVDRIVDRGTVKGIVQKRKKVTIASNPLDEPTFVHDPDTGTKTRVFPGNDRVSKGDSIKKPPKGGGSGSKGGNGSGDDDEFSFYLTKDEFLNALFEDMALPNYVKDSFTNDVKYKLVRAGYTTEGPMNKLNMKKTFQQSLARRLAFKGARKERGEDEDKPINFLEDVDLRYNLYAKEPFPVRKAVMFCVLDTSGSMTEFHKDLSKRFFMLLYLFLNKQYDHVEIRFIRHAETAEEVSEYDFFYKRKSGGTVVSTAFTLIDSIRTSDYNDESWNVYVAQASDGDNFTYDDDDLLSVLQKKILPAIQYMAYIQVYNGPMYNDYFGEGGSTGGLFELYDQIDPSLTNFAKRTVGVREEVFPVLRGLFKKGANDE